jgi:hypothetical protein
VEWWSVDFVMDGSSVHLGFEFLTRMQWKIHPEKCGLVAQSTGRCSGYSHLDGLML